MSRLRVGVVGLNYWGPNLARNFDELAELAYVCDLSPELRGAANEAFAEFLETFGYED